MGCNRLRYLTSLLIIAMLLFYHALLPLFFLATATVTAVFVSQNPFGSSDWLYSPRTIALASSKSINTATSSFSSVLVPKVRLLPDADAVGQEVRRIVQESAQQAIATRGVFCLAIPGGSVLKMLMTAVEDGRNMQWTSKTYLAYVNHKCIDMENETLATHAKARKLFLEHWNGCKTLVLNGTNNGPNEAVLYQNQLEQLVADGILPVNQNSVPVFDLALIGVGDDGHIGSLYPNRKEVLESTQWVVSVDVKDPPSISLSLPVMQAAKQVVVAACGVSEKYPQGKSDAMRRAICGPNETLTTFPAIGLRPVATWILDKAAASKLDEAYKQN